MIAETSSVLHSWCVQADWNAPTIVGGEGAWFWDESGHTYLDMSSLAECMNLGHQHPRLIRAIQEQAQKLLTTGKTGLLEGFISKRGRPFSAYLKLEDGKIGFEFPERTTAVSESKQTS